MATLSQRIVRAALDIEVKRLVLNKKEIVALSKLETIAVSADEADKSDRESVESLRRIIADASGIGTEAKARLEASLEAAEVDLGLRPAPPVKTRAKKDVAPPAPPADPAALATDAVS